MACLDQTALTKVSHGRGMVEGEAHPDCKRKQRRRRTELGLEIADSVLCDNVISDLLDDWLIPAIVDSVIRDLTNPTREKSR